MRDDVSLATLYSEILPKDADTSTSLGEALRLSIPIISSDMDTVTEGRMAIAMAQAHHATLAAHNIMGMMLRLVQSGRHSS